MKVINLALKKIDRDRQVELTLQTSEGTYVFEFGKLTARQLMRALFLSVGVEPKLKDREEGSLPARKPTWLE